MRKLMIILLLMFVAFVNASNAEAGSWSIHCENDSCVAAQGALRVYWVATSSSQSKTMGKKINIDYTLAFIEWLGDTNYRAEQTVKTGI